MLLKLSEKKKIPVCYKFCMNSSIPGKALLFAEPFVTGLIALYICTIHIWFLVCRITYSCRVLHVNGFQHAPF